MPTFHILFLNLFSDKDTCLFISQKYGSICQRTLKKVREEHQGTYDKLDAQT